MLNDVVTLGWVSHKATKSLDGHAVAFDSVEHLLDKKSKPAGTDCTGSSHPISTAQLLPIERKQGKGKMYGWMLAGSAAVLALRELYRWIVGDQDQDQDLRATAYQDLERNSRSHSHRDPSFGSHASSSVQNPSVNDSKDPPRQSDRSPICYYEHYPNLFNSSSTKNSQQQSEYGNGKSMEGTKPPPSTDLSDPFLSQSSSSSTSDQLRSSYVKANPPATESQSPASFKNLPSSKPTLTQIHSNSTSQPTKANYMRVVQKDTSPIYMIPKDIENLIKKDIVPDVLKNPVSPATYKDYFAALLYAEDFYVEKWNNFQLFYVTLELHEAAIYDKLPKNKNFKKNAEKDDKIFVALKIDSVPEKRPFILSRDFVFARRSGSEARKFQGIVYRVVKSNVVLVEFEEEFYSQHDRNHRYDISFSFNRVCLKRAHQAISAVASGSLLENFLFPEHAIRKNTCSSSLLPCVYSDHTLDLNSISAVRQILSFKGHPPYLVEGPLCGSTTLSKTGLVVREAVLQIHRRSPSNCRILICSPLNNTGDILLRSLKNEISESVMFRANAAFREVDGVPADILSSCVYEGDCFSLPSLQQLKQFRIIFSTFVSSFRLLTEGISAGHFSHMFLVDASSATEPETMIPLSNLANESTTVILTGAPNNQTSWVRSDIARKNGLRTSYFERLRATKIYRSSDPTFIMQL